MLSTGGEVQNCNSRYGAFKGDELLINVQGYANKHILRSFQFLLMVNIYYCYYIQYLVILHIFDLIMSSINLVFVIISFKYIMNIGILY